MKVVQQGVTPSMLLSLRLEDRTPAEAVFGVLEGLGLNYAFALDGTGNRIETLILAGASGAKPTVATTAPATRHSRPALRAPSRGPARRRPRRRPKRRRRRRPRRKPEEGEDAKRPRKRSEGAVARSPGQRAPDAGGVGVPELALRPARADVHAAAARGRAARSRSPRRRPSRSRPGRAAARSASDGPVSALCPRPCTAAAGPAPPLTL